MNRGLFGFPRKGTHTPFVGFSGRRNGAVQTFTNNVETNIIFQEIEYDYGGFLKDPLRASKLVIPISGLYLLAGNTHWASNSTGVRVINFRKNGVITRRLSLASGGAFTSGFGLTQTIYFDAGDLCEMVLLQSSGGNLNSSSVGDSFPCFSVTLLGILP